MIIAGLTKTTLLDYPGKVAASVFTGGCNFRCPYCHNKDIILNHTVPYRADELLSFLEKRRTVLSGVCITGGEPTIHSDLPDLIRDIKSIGYCVKLDTNGSNPSMLYNLIHRHLIDYCAMDVKNAPRQYAKTAGWNDSAQTDFCLPAIQDSVNILLSQSAFPYEFRTTVVAQLHSSADMLAISKWLTGARAYYLQSYTDSAGVLCAGCHAHSEETLQSFVKICQQFIPNTTLRGIS